MSKAFLLDRNGAPRLIAERSPGGRWTVHDVLSDLLSPGDDVTQCINTRPRLPPREDGACGR